MNEFLWIGFWVASSAVTFGVGVVFGSAVTGAGYMHAKKHQRPVVVNINNRHRAEFGDHYHDEVWPDEDEEDDPARPRDEEDGDDSSLSNKITFGLSP